MMVFGVSWVAAMVGAWFVAGRPWPCIRCGEDHHEEVDVCAWCDGRASR
jgi:hypothetical protein